MSTLADSIRAIIQTSRLRRAYSRLATNAEGCFFFAAGAVLTALAVKYATASWLWDIIFLGGIGAMILSAIDAASRQVAMRRGWRAAKMWLIFGMIGGAFLFIGCAVALYFGPNRPAREARDLDSMISQLDADSRYIVTTEYKVKIEQKRKTLGPFDATDGTYGYLAWPEVRQIVSRLVGKNIFAVAPNDARKYLFTEFGEQIARRLLDNERKSDDVSLFIECNVGTTPAVFPKSGRFYILHVFPGAPETGGAGMGYQFGQPGGEAGRDFQLAYECKITNYGKAPVFNVLLQLQATFSKAIVDPNAPGSRQKGPTIATQEWPLKIPKIDSGVENPFIFYLKSSNPYWIDVSLPDYVPMQLGGEEATRTVKLIRPTDTNIPLYPYIDPMK